MRWALERIRTRTGGIPVLYLQHGVRSGGTRAVLNVVLARLCNEPGVRVLVARHELHALRFSVMETVFEILPPSLIVERNQTDQRYAIAQSHGGRGTLFFGGLNDETKWGSTEFGVISIHEAHQITERQYRYVKNRATQAGHQGMVLMEGNPPSASHWLNHLTDPRDPGYDPDIMRLELSTFENWENLDPAYRRSLEGMPPAWRQRYLLGKTAALPSGTPVYPSFLEEHHVGDTALVPDRPILRFWDFGFRNPACLWAQQDADYRLLVHREWMPPFTPEDAFIEGVISRTVDWFGERTCRDSGDPAAAQRDPTGISTLRRLHDHGILLQYRPTTYADRIPLINRKFSELIQGKPAVRINPLCQILIEGLAGGYHFEDVKEGARVTGQKELPYKDGWFEHLVNSLEYGMTNLYMGSTALAPMLAQHREHRTQRQHELSRRRGVVSF